MRVISKVTGMLWRSAIRNLHSERYPNYKYKLTKTTVYPTL